MFKSYGHLFSIFEALKEGGSIGNKMMHGTISKGRSIIIFDRLFKCCPTGQLTGVTLKTTDDVGVTANTKSIGRIGYG